MWRGRHERALGAARAAAAAAERQGNGPDRSAWARHLTRVALLLVVATPALGLAWLAFRSISMDRAAVDQEARQRVEDAADRLSVAVASEVAALERLLDRAGDEAPASNETARALDPLGEGPVAVLLHVDGRGRVLVQPQGRLLWTIGPGAPGEPVDSEAAGRLHRQARDDAKRGRVEEAVRAYSALSEMPGSIGGTPASLVAAYETCVPPPSGAQSEAPAFRHYRESRLPACAAALYADLVDGRWQLDRARFSFYLEDARALLPPPTKEPRLAEAAARFEDKAALTGAVEAFLAALSSERPTLSGCRVVTPERETADHPPAVSLACARVRPPGGLDAIVLAPRDFTDRWLPRLSEPLSAAGIAARIDAADGRRLSGPDAAGPAPAVSATRLVRDEDLRWLVRTWPANPSAWYAAFRQRQRLQLGMLLLAVASLGLGIVLTVRTLRREVQVARMKGQFVSAVTHEFRSPLTGIRQLAELLQQDRVRTEARRRQYYDMMVADSRRLERLVDNVLDVARMDEGQQLFHFEPTDTASWLRSAVSEFERAPGAGDGRIAVALPAELPLIRADAETLKTALHNLLDNAVKYSPASAPVRVTAARAGSDVEIAVSDEGAGIPLAEQARIFDRFYRVPGEGTRTVKGTGLGLSLVRQIMAAHGGRVDVQSRPGSGSTFVLRVPAANEGD